MSKVAHYGRNVLGKDYAVGDIHGQLNALTKLLKRVNFDTSKDRLFNPGDFFDRGPDPFGILDLMKRPWFKGSLGNHELALIHIARRLPDWERLARSPGRAWFVALEQDKQLEIAEYLETLPFAMDVETPDGKVGFVHALTYLDWDKTVESLHNPSPGALLLHLQSRERFKSNDHRLVANVRAVIVGHMVQPFPTWRGNTLYLDTGAGSDRVLTMVELGSLCTFYSRDTK